MKRLYPQKTDLRLFHLILIILSILVLSKICSAEVSLGEINSHTENSGVGINKLKEDRLAFTLGLGATYFGVYGNLKAGVLAKDGYGYPKGEIDLSWWRDNIFGLGYTWILELPSEVELEKATKAVIEKQGENLQYSQLPGLIRKELNKDRLSYVTVGMFGTIPPTWLTLFSFEFGWMWLVQDNVRVKIGLGWPTAIECDLHFDL